MWEIALQTIFIGASFDRQYIGYRNHTNSATEITRNRLPKSPELIINTTAKANDTTDIVCFGRSIYYKAI